MRYKQRGVILIAAVTIFMMIAMTAILSMTGAMMVTKGKRFSSSSFKVDKTQKALIEFVAKNRRLPCPANPTADPSTANAGYANGDSNNEAPTNSTCTYRSGVVPWRALGLTQNDVVDEWGRMISYRVYDDSVLGLTLADGATAVNCDTDNESTANIQPTASGQCDNTSGAHDTLRRHFVTFVNSTIPDATTASYDKGLRVDNAGQTVANVAFVLISHGVSGLGAYTPSGARMTMPDVLALDYNNTQTQDSPNLYKKLSASEATISPGTSGHYDDIVKYLSIAELLKLAGQEARNWPEPANHPVFDATTTVNMISPSTDPAKPHFLSTGGNTPNVDVGQEFTKTTPDGTAVQAGAVAGSYSACLWWPNKFSLVTSTGKKALTTYVEFAAADNASGDSFAGFTLGFLSGSDAAGPPNNNTCGTSTAVVAKASGASGQRVLSIDDATGIEVGMNVYGNGIDTSTFVSGISGNTVTVDQNTIATLSNTSISFANSRLIRRDLGWAGGTVANFTDRFAVEFDANSDVNSYTNPTTSSSFDPTRPHLAIDLGGVVHGVKAESCSQISSSAAGNGLVCDSEIANFPSISNRAAAGISGQSNITVTDVTGIVHGMTVTGSGIQSSTIVIAIVGNVLTLSKTLSGNVTSASFNSLSTSNFMQNGLTVFHSMRVEVYPNSCVNSTATGLSGASSITVNSNNQIESGMYVYGQGISSGAKVTGVSGKVISVSLPNASAVSGSIVFGESSSALTQSQSRSLVKSWTLSNAGCNQDPTLCAALKNTATKFTSDITGNRQAMHAVSCIPAPVNANAYDSLYFGITTANRSNSGTALVNAVFTNLKSSTLALP